MRSTPSRDLGLEQLLGARLLHTTSSHPTESPKKSVVSWRRVHSLCSADWKDLLQSGRGHALGGQWVHLGAPPGASSTT